MKRLLVPLVLWASCLAALPGAQAQGTSTVPPAVQGGAAPATNNPNFDSSPGHRFQQEAVPADPRVRAKVHTELAALYFQAGSMAVALEELKIATTADPRYAPAYSVRGLVHAYLREFAQAEEQFQKALNLTPDDPEVNNNYGWFLCQSGNEKESIKYFLAALKSPLYATPDIAYANAGGCALKAGDLDAAETYLYQAARLSRDGALGVRTQLADLNFRRGRFEEALRLINGVLKDSQPATPDALWLALRLERRLGNRAAEGNLAAELRRRYPDSREYQDFLKGKFE